eukprot:2095295-Karenia_brevis.AAC.1
MVCCSWAPEDGDDTMLMNAWWWDKIWALKSQATWTNLLKSDFIGLDEMKADASNDKQGVRTLLFLFLHADLSKPS